MSDYLPTIVILFPFVALLVSVFTFKMHSPADETVFVVSTLLLGVSLVTLLSMYVHSLENEKPSTLESIVSHADEQGYEQVSLTAGGFPLFKIEGHEVDDDKHFSRIESSLIEKAAPSEDGCVDRTIVGSEVNVCGVQGGDTVSIRL